MLIISTRNAFISSTAIAVVIAAVLYIDANYNQKAASEKTSQLSNLADNSCTVSNLQSDEEVFFVGCGGFF